MDCVPVVVGGNEALCQHRGSLQSHRTLCIGTMVVLNVVCATVIYDIILLTPSAHGIAHNPTHTHTHTHTHLKLDHMISLHVTTNVTT